MEMAGMLRARGSDLSKDGALGDELGQLLDLGVCVFPCHPVGSVRPGRWYRYALDSPMLSLPDTIARSHAAASAVMLAELLVRQGREVPADLAAMATRVLAEGGAGWVSCPVWSRC